MWQAGAASMRCGCRLSHGYWQGMLCCNGANANVVFFQLQFMQATHPWQLRPLHLACIALVSLPPRFSLKQLLPHSQPLSCMFITAK